MNYWPYLVALVVLAGLMAFSIRNRRRQVAEQTARASRIGVGTEVMTTSGLYGTVVGRNQDDTVTLSIAPGVEVKWAVAALRDASALAGTYRRGIAAGTATAEGAAGAGDADDGVDDGAGIDLDVEGKTYDGSGHEVQLHKSDDTPRARPREKSRGKAPGTAGNDEAGS